jgi:hypothetical protein
VLHKQKELRNRKFLPHYPVEHAENFSIKYLQNTGLALRDREDVRAREKGILMGIRNPMERHS